MLGRSIRTQEVLRCRGIAEQSARDAGDAVEVSVNTSCRQCGRSGLDDGGKAPAAASGAEIDAGDVEMVLEDGVPGSRQWRLPTIWMTCLTPVMIR